MTMEEQDQYYLEKASIPQALLHLCIPMILAMSANVIYSIINAYFIGTLHDTAMLSAITVGFPVLSLDMAVGGVFGIGGGTYISRLLGENNTNEMKHVSSFILYSSLLVGFVLMIVCFLAINPLVHVLGTDSYSFGAAKNYVTYLVLFLPVLIANTVVEQIVRAVGAAKQSMYGMLISIAANFFFDVLLILVLHLNVVGAALAVGLSNVASLAYLLWFLHGSTSQVSLAIQHLRFTKTMIKQVLSIGLSELIMSSFMIVTSLLFNNFAIRYSDDVIAAFGVAQRIVQIPELISIGIFTGIMPLLGYTFGAKNFARLKLALTYSIGAILGNVLVFASIVFLFRNQLLSLFSQSHSVISLGVYILTALLVSSLFNGFTGLFLAYFQATNKPLQTTIMSFTQGGLFIPVIFIAQAIIGLNGVIWATTITEVSTCIIGVSLFMLSKEKFGPDYPII